MANDTPSEGSIVHHDYISSDPKATEAFFSKAFGWKMQSWDETYTMFEGPPGTAGGIRKPNTGEQVGAFNYINVANLDAKLKDVVAAGATVILPRQEIPDMGALAVFVVPGGIVQGIWQAKM